jgi:molybdopterin converting factor small subunit
MAMAVEIQTAGMLKQHIPSGATVDNVSTVGEAIQQLGLDHSGEIIMLVNGKPAYWNTELHDGDTLSLLPGISGGCGSIPAPRKFHPPNYIQPPP